jgi:hypothetical protein
VRNRVNSGEPGGNWGVIVERSGLMSSEMTEHERDGGLKADGPELLVHSLSCMKDQKNKGWRILLVRRECVLEHG